jgi:hypothetical protein
MYSILRSCNSGTAFVVRPDVPFGHDIREIAGRLAPSGHEVLTDAGVLLVIRSPDGVEYSLFREGKVLVKTGDEELAWKVVRSVETGFDG